MNIQQKIDEGCLLGCIKYNGNCCYYFMPLAYWILDYKRYNPYYKPDDWEFIFRNNILTVDEYNVVSFIKAVESDKIEHDQVLEIERTSVSFFIDFDTKLFISSFVDVEVEEYLPTGGWRGKYDDPLNYLPPGCVM